MADSSRGKIETRLIACAGRTIEVRPMAEGTILVLARVTRMRLDTPPELLTQEQRQRLLANIGYLGEILDSVIVSETDRDWLSTALIYGEIQPEQALEILRETAQAFNAEKAPATGPKKTTARRVRRG